jgi:hypothetical protein
MSFCPGRFLLIFFKFKKREIFGTGMCVLGKWARIGMDHGPWTLHLIPNHSLAAGNITGRRAPAVNLIIPTG